MDILDKLGRQLYFITLEMTKTYHQRFMYEQFNPLTAFITP